MSRLEDKTTSIGFEPTFNYTEVAEALGVSESFIQKEAACGRLRATRLGRRMVVTQSDIDEWWQNRHERQADKRAVRVTRKDQNSPRKKKTKREIQADPDIIAGLGLSMK